MIRASDVRARYPNPVTIDAWVRLQNSEQYCVGGALCQFIGGEYGCYRFPFVFFADVLKTANPKLNEHKNPHLFSGKIRRANDRGQFDWAWRWLDAALMYGQPHYRERKVRELVESATVETCK